MGAAGIAHTLPEPVVALGWSAALRLCTELCHACESCAYISISLKFRDCSLYRTCSRRLRRFADLRSARLWMNGSDALATAEERQRASVVAALCPGPLQGVPAAAGSGSDSTLIKE